MFVEVLADAEDENGSDRGEEQFCASFTPGEQEMAEEHCVVEEATSVGKGLSSLEKSVGANTIWVDAPPRSSAPRGFT